MEVCAGAVGTWGRLQPGTVGPRKAAQRCSHMRASCKVGRGRRGWRSRQKKKSKSKDTEEPNT